MKNKLLNISIITVCYNVLESGRKDFFKQMLDSIHNQTYSHIEHVIVDGASNDGSVAYIEAMIQPYQHRSITLISEPDTGIYDAMNKGWRLATGDYIAYLNSDDFYHDPTGIETIVSTLQKRPVDFLATSTRMIACKQDNAKTERFKDVFTPDLGRFLMHMPLPHPGLFVARNQMEKLGGFDHKRFKLAGDYDLIVRLMLTKDITWTVLSYSFTSFRLGGLSADDRLNQEEIAAVFKKNYSDHLPGYTSNDWKNLAATRKLPIGLLEGVSARFSINHWQGLTIVNRHYSYTVAELERVERLFFHALQGCHTSNIADSQSVEVSLATTFFWACFYSTRHGLSLYSLYQRSKLRYKAKVSYKYKVELFFRALFRIRH